MMRTKQGNVPSSQWCIGGWDKIKIGSGGFFISDLPCRTAQEGSTWYAFSSEQLEGFLEDLIKVSLTPLLQMYPNPRFS